MYKRLKNRYEQTVSKSIKDVEDQVQMKELFLANISHETRTPLNVIIGLTHLLKQTELNIVQKKHLETIERSSNLLLSITNEILDFSKIEAGKMEINQVEFDLNNVLEDVADMIVVGAKQKNLELLFDVAPDIDFSLTGDPLRLTQVLINLLNNAVKFTEKGYVTLKIEKVPHESVQTLRFEVIDTGIGMTDEVTLSIFDAFSQADSRISRNFGGTGLGLAITNELVTMMKGKLDVKSTLRHGSIFGVTLGFGLYTKEDDVQHKYMSRLLADKEILIIDSSGLAKILNDLLIFFGAKPVVSTKRRNLTQLLSFNHFDVVMLDTSFRTDQNLMAQLQSQSDHLILMGYEMPQLDHSAEVLLKPFTPLKLLNMMSRLFDKSVVKPMVKEKEYTFKDLLILGGSRILLAEDNEGNRMVVRGLLQESGIIIIEANDGQKAVEAMLQAKEPYDMVLMDINMPVMDGYVSTSIIREYQKFDHIPIIALTANITQSQIEKAKSYGMQGHLNKPIDTKLFYKMLLQHIQPKQQVKLMSEVGIKEEKLKHSIFKLSGVDSETGLARLNGNEKLYNDVLLKFADIFSDAIVTLKSMLEKNDYKAAADYAHNLKGLSGNIGADAIYEISTDLDAACKDQSQSAQTIVEELNTLLTPLIKEINAQSIPHTTVSKKAITPAQLKQFIFKLNEAADRQKGLEAKKICEALTQYDWPLNQQKILSEIVKATREYDFVKVQKLIGYMNTQESKP